MLVLMLNPSGMLFNNVDLGDVHLCTNHQFMQDFIWVDIGYPMLHHENGVVIIWI